MRISDWISDVCSSDLALDTTRAPPLSGGSRWAIRASSINSKRAGLRDWIRPQRSRHTWRGKMQPRSSSRERRETALAEIGRCVLQDRHDSYGDQEDNFQALPDRWTVLFRGRGARKRVVQGKSVPVRFDIGVHRIFKHKKLERGDI